MVILASAHTIYIPSLTVFECMSLAEYREQFIPKDAQSVVIPLVEPNGFYFDYKIGDQERAGLSLKTPSEPFDEEINLHDVIKYFAETGLSIYLSLELSLPELASSISACGIEDQSGARSGHCCINNPLTTGYLEEVLSTVLPAIIEAHGEKIKGFSVSAKDFWPMSARSGRFLITCFCASCSASLQSYNANLTPDKFSAYPSCINLALAESEYVDDDGDAYGMINPVNKFTREIEPEGLLHVCAQTKGTLVADAFDNGSYFTRENDFTKKASLLLLFTKARSQLTLNACKRVFEILSELAPERQRILISEATDYDWASGLFLTDFRPGVCDEVWLPPKDRLPPKIAKVKPLLSKRACYYVDAFVDLCAMLRSPARSVMFMNNMSLRKVKKMLARTEREASGDVILPSDAVLPAFYSGDHDAIAIGVDRDLLAKMSSNAWEIFEARRNE